MTYVSIHGARLGLLGDGTLRVDGKVLKGMIPTLGRDIFVDSVTGADTSDGLTPDRALATLDAAFASTHVVANKGYNIYILPLHSETITGAGGVAHDVAGVSVYGLGHGYTTRPKILLDGGTAVTYLISAKDAHVEGLDLTSGHSNVVTAFGVTATGAHIADCKFRDNTTNEDFLVCITATGADNTADGLTVTDCDWTTIDTDDTAMINTANSILDFTAIGNHMVTTSATAAPFMKCEDGALLINGRIGHNHCFNLMSSGELFISNNGTTNTGVIYNNFSGHADVSGAHDNGWATGGWRLFENYSASTHAVMCGNAPAVDVDL